jgi:PAS domain S-box-containing protein
MERLSSGKEIKVISQNRNYSKHGDVIECVWYNSVLFDEKRKMSSVMSLVENVTLLKRYQKELISSNEKYEELLANARSIIVKQDTSGKFTYINEFGLQFFGFDEEEIIGKMATDTIIPPFESTGRNLNEMIESIYRDPDMYSTNINENIKKSGERVWIEWHNKAIFNNDNERTGHIAIGVDITIRKRAEEALIESEHKLWSVLNATQESIYMFDKNGIILMANATGLRRIKKTAEQFIGHHFSEFLPPGVATLRQLKLDEVINTGKQVKFEDERDGKIYAHNFFPVFKNNKVASIVTYSRDITIRKKAESNLRESEDRFRTIAESLPVLIAITAVSDLGFMFINESAEKSFGYKKNTLANQKLSDLFYSRDDLKELGRILGEKGKIFNKEIRVLKADGTPFWIMTSIRRISFMNVPAYLTAATDITETKKNQEELIRLNRTLNAQSRSSQAMMHTRNENNYLNQVCKIIARDCGHELVWIGYAMNDDHKSVKPMAYNGFDNGYINHLDITWSDNEHGNGPTGRAIKTGKPALCRNMLSDPSFMPWKKAALERGYLSSLVLPLNQEGKTFGAISIYSKTADDFSPSEIALLTGLADDLAYGISYIRLAEAERAAARAIKENEVKLKELVVTKDKFFNIVAHDLKNPFTSLLGSSELLYDNINNMTSDNVRKLALILNDSAKGGYAILQNLLDWSRSQTGLIKFNPEKLILKNIIEENFDNFQLQVMKKEINLRSEVNGDISVWADKNMINTVMRNLLSNAVKYTFKNGTIVVKAIQGPRETTLSVRDTGIGMSAEKVKSLFVIDNSLSLPGTEKEQGTGLGLKLCKEFTERMGGGIWVESEAGKGSEFKFTIPVVKKYDTTL